MKILNTPTMQSTLESILETMQITDNIWQSVADGERTPAEARELIDALLVSDEVKKGSLKL